MHAVVVTVVVGLITTDVNRLVIVCVTVETMVVGSVVIKDFVIVVINDAIIIGIVVTVVRLREVILDVCVTFCAY